MIKNTYIYIPFIYVLFIHLNTERAINFDFMNTESFCDKHSFPSAKVTMPQAVRPQE